MSHLCRDCRFAKPFRNPFPSYELAMCGKIVNVTDGKPAEFCSNARRFGPCRIEGLLFEPKFSVWGWLRRRRRARAEVLAVIAKAQSSSRQVMT
jgi:hypothetical protein